MEFTHYQTEAQRHAVYPDKGNNFVFPTLGIGEEAGEITGKVKKLLRDRGVASPKDLTPADIETITLEMGDLLWYLAALAQELQVSLDTVAEKNLEKIAERRARGTVHGSGDNR